VETINVYYTKLNNKIISERIFNTYLLSLPYLLQKKIRRLKREKSQIHSLIGYKLVQYALSENGFSISYLLNIEFEKEGKPFIPDTFNFNISHSENIVVCSISSKKIGVDIEKIRKINVENMTPFLTTQEYNKLLNSRNTDIEFANIWTKKEAFVKAIGKGMSINFANINISNNKISYLNNNWFLQKLEIDNSYVSFVSTSIEKPIVNLKCVDF